MEENAEHLTKYSHVLKSREEELMEVRSNAIQDFPAFGLSK